MKLVPTRTLHFNGRKKVPYKTTPNIKYKTQNTIYIFTMTFLLFFKESNHHTQLNNDALSGVLCSELYDEGD